MRGMRVGCAAVVLAVVLWLAWILLSVWASPPTPRVTAVLYVGRDAQAGQAGDEAVTGVPTISAVFIERVLMAYHSPAVGTGSALYGLGVRYGIDPVYALAFFQHEDGFGTTGWGAVNHSLGNLRCGGWPSSLCRGGFRSYPTFQAGYEDWYRLIRDGYVRGLVTVPLVGHVCTTVAAIVPVYAPSGDGNDVAAYIVAVEHAVVTWRNGQVWT